MEALSDWKKKTAIFLSGQAITLFGSSLVQFALVWYVTLETSSGFWVSMLTICAHAPQFIMSFFSGVWADRYSRKMLIIVSDVAIAVTTLILALLLPYINNNSLLLSILLIVSAIRSLGTGIQTPAVGAVLPQLVPSDKLMRVNGINSTIQSIVQFAAPAAAGAILSIGTLQSTLFIDIATAFVGVGLLCCIAIPKTVAAVQREHSSMFTDLKAGVKYAVEDGFLWKLLLLYGGFVFLCVPAGFLATLFVSRAYGDSYGYLTIVELVGFAGMMGGGVLISVWGGFKSKLKTLGVGMLLFGALAIGMGSIDNFIIYLILMLIYGIALTMVQTATTTLIQQRAEEQVQGRVFGFLNAMYSGALPLGMAVFGPLADVVSMNWLMIGSGAILVVISAVILLKRRHYSIDKGETH